jgi:hypothetical protein
MAATLLADYIANRKVGQAFLAMQVAANFRFAGTITVFSHIEIPNMPDRIVLISAIPFHHRQ